MILLDGHGLTIEGLWRIARGDERCALAPAARGAMARSRALVEELAAQPRAIYGISTGFGPLSHERVSPDEQADLQLNLLYHLAVGQGEPLSDVETRAVMAARANALARGFSGIRPEVADLLLDALGAGVLPEIPSEGSVGASGDLAPLAHMALVLVGGGYARFGGRRLPGGEALRLAGLCPVSLRCKEGLALINGTSVMTALAALSAREAGAVLGWMELMGACLMQAMYGEPEALCERVHRARGHRGQFVSAMRIASHLMTHPEYRARIEEHQWGATPKPVEPGTEVQDPYSIRCAPQILGAFQDSLWHVEHTVTRELNASTDNPLVFPEDRSVIHCGNFYGQQIAMACDFLRIGLASAALLAERQMERLLNRRYSMGLPPLLTGGRPGLNSGLAGCQLLATSLAAEVRLAAVPASVQTIPTNANNQDVVSMGTVSARMTRRMLDAVWKILAVEALALAQAADLRKRARRDVMGKDYAALYARVRAVSPTLERDRPLFEDIARVAAMLKSEDAQAECLPPRPPNPIRMELK